mmetsp:Transcript_3897/g.15109  ORF Transcript_3897/g.15109 Transcript_3897/m.15109 type:complete len:209 (+) Transcript_3897:174-800(+)
MSQQLAEPSASPSARPSSSPSAEPSVSPSATPSSSPSASPIDQLPSAMPVQGGLLQPTLAPHVSLAPSIQPPPSLAPSPFPVHKAAKQSDDPGWSSGVGTFFLILAILAAAAFAFRWMSRQRRRRRAGNTDDDMTYSPVATRSSLEMAGSPEFGPMGPRSPQESVADRIANLAAKIRGTTPDGFTLGRSKPEDQGFSRLPSNDSDDPT